MTTYFRVGALSRILFAAALAAAILTLAARPAPADTYSWSGLSTTSWADSGSWFDINSSLNGVPGSGDIALFGGSSYPLQPTLPAAQQVGGVWDTGAGSVTISSQTLTINGTTINGNPNTGIEMDAGAGSLAISSALTLGGAQTWLNNSSGTLVTAAINNNGNLLTFGGIGNASFGAISGSGGLTMNGGGVLLLPSTNTYSGGTIVNSGTLTLTAGGGSGDIRGPLTINPGGYVNLSVNTDDLGYNGGASVTTVSNSGGIINNATGGNQGYITNFVLTGGTMTSTGGGLYNIDISTGHTITTFASSATSVISGPIGVRNNGNLVITVPQGTTASGIDLLISGAMNNGGAGSNGLQDVVKAGNGVLELSGGNSYLGVTTISGGTLIANYGGGSTTTTPLGNLSAAGSAAVNPGAALVLAAGNSFGGGNSNLTWTMSINGGLLTSNSINSNNDLGNLVLSGGTIQTNNGVQGTTQWQSYNFNGSVTVSGTSASYIVPVSGTTENGITLGASQAAGYQTPFTVNSTGAGGPDLTVAVPMWNNSESRTSGFIKQGNGTMALTASNGYTGVTTITAGTLMLGNGQSGQDGSINTTSGVTDNATLAFNYYGNQTISNYAISGTGGVVQVGGAMTTLSKANSYVGGTSISNGTLQLGNAAALSSGTVGVNGGVLDVNGLTPSTGAITLFSGSIINSGGTGSINNVAFHNYNTRSGTVSAVLGGAAGLNQNAAGLTLLTAANTYTGPTTVSAGTLMLGPTGTLGSGNATISAGAVLDTSSYGAAGYNFNSGVLAAGRSGTPGTDINGSLNVNNATLSPVGTMTVNGNLSLNQATFAYNSGAQVAVNGALSLMGTDYVIPNASLTAGTYTLFTYNSLAAGGTSDLAMGGASGSNPRQSYSFGLAGNSITLTVTGTAGNLQWSGGNNSTWDTAVSQSWLNLNNGSADYFYTGDNVTFNDTPGTATTVTINGAVQPGSLTVSNTNESYTFSGSGSIAGTTSLVMNGPGALTIATSNSYAGGTYLNGGTLNANAVSALGVGPLTISGGTLGNTSGAAVTLSNAAQNWNGSFTFLGSNPLNMGTGPVTLGASPTLYVSASTLTVGGVISGAGALTKNGPGTLVLGGSNTYFGGTSLLNGTLAFAAGGLGTTGPIALSGGTTLEYLSGNTQDISSRLTLTSGTSTINLNGNTVTYASAIGGSGGLAEIGGGNLLVSGASTFSGGVFINSGTLTINGAGGGAGPFANSTITIAAGSELALNVADSMGYSDTGAVTVYGTLAKTFSQSETIGRPIILSGGTMTSTGTFPATNGAWDFDGANDTISTVPGTADYIAGTGGFSLRTSTCFFNIGANSSLTISVPIIQNTNSTATPLNLEGSGLLLLTGSSTYSGATNIAGGTLEIGGAGVLSAGTSSSTAGIYSLAIGNSGALVFNTSSNQTLSGVISGTGTLTQAGASTLTLTATNTYSGGTTISNGTLNVATIVPVGGASNIGNATTAIALGNSFGAAGTLNYTGSSAKFAPGLALAAGGGSVIVANAGQTLTFGGATGSGPLTVAGAGNASFSGAITGGSVSFTAATSGIVTLAGNNTFGGSTTVAPGSALYLNGANATTSITVGNPSTQAGAILGGTGSASSAVVNVADGSILDFSQNTGSTFAVAALNFVNQTNGITLNLNDAGGQYSSKPAISAGTLTTSFGPSPISVNVNNVPTGSGQMEILQYAGTIGGGGFGQFYLNSPYDQGRAYYNLVNVPSAGGGYIDLSYAVDYLHWTGAVNLANGWDTTTPNWVLNSTGGTTTYQDNTDIVVFDDRAGPHGTVNMATVLYPANVTFSNTATSYLLQGPGGISGPTAVTINGAGSVTIATSQNSYTGGTFLTSGTLNANSVSALGSGVVSVSGGVLNDGAIGSLGAGPLAVSGGVANLANPQAIASVALSGGLLNVGNALALGSGTLAISGGTLDNTSGGPMSLSANNNPLAINGSFTFLGSNQLNTGTGPVTISGGPTLNVSASTLTVAGPITGGGGLTKAGNGTLALLGANSYSGTTTVAGGSLVGNTATLPGPINLANNANVTLNQTVNGIWGQTISGNGGLTVQGGATLQVGTPQTYSGATVVTAGTTLQLPQVANIGIKFTLSQGTAAYTVTGSAGAVPMSNWTNIAGLYNGGATPQALTNNLGMATPTTVTWAGSEDNYSTFGANQADQNAQLLNSYLDNTGGTETVTVTGVPYSNYSAYVYFASDGTGRSGTVSIAGVNLDYSTTSNVATRPYPLVQTTDSTGANPNANYAVFTGLSGSSFTIGQIRGSNNTGIAAVEIVASQSQVLPATTQVQLASGATFDLNGDSQTVASLADVVPGAGGSTVTNSLAPATLTLSPTGGSALYSGTIQNGNSTVSLVLNGPGLQIFSGTNTYTGATTISAGTLQLGTGSPGADSLLSTSAVTDNGALVYSLAGSQTVSYVVSGSGSLTKVGSGVLVMGSSGGYSGPTTVGGGKLYLSGANATQSILVAGGATLGGAASAASATATVANTGVLEAGSGGFGSLTLGGLTFNNTAVVNVNNPYQYATNAAIVTTASNGLTVNGGTGSVVFNVAGVSPGGSGTIELMQYSGSIQGPNGFAAFGLNTSGLTGRGGTYALTSVPGYIDLSYNVDYPIWTGSVNNVWDTNTTPNWVLAIAETATTFHVNDTVVFNDSAGTNNVVNISAGNVTPGTVTFSNSNVAYTLQGSFGIVGPAPLTVNGGGSVTITNSNGYLGGTSVSNGSTLNLNAAQAIGTGPLTLSGGTVYANTPQSPSSIALGGGVLSFAASTLGSASVVFSGGTLQWQAGNTQDISSQINIANPGQIAYLNPNGNNVPIGSSISGSGGLALVGGGTLTVTNFNTYTGGTIINSGVLAAAFGGSATQGSLPPGEPITVNSGGTLQMNVGDALGYYGGNPSLITLNGSVLTSSSGAFHVTLPGFSLTAGTITAVGPGDGSNYIFDGTITTNASSSPSVIATLGAVDLRNGGGTAAGGTGGGANGSVTFNVARGTGAVDLLVTSNLINNDGANGLIKAGPGVMVLTATANGAGIPTSTSSFTGNITINGGTLIAAAVSQSSGTNGVLGEALNTRTITVNSGGVLQFDVPNVFGQFNATTAPTLNIDGGVVANAEPGAPYPAGLINNALYNIDLSSGTLTATTGQHGGYAAWNVNGAVTSSGSSLISTSDPIYGTVMLSSTGSAANPGMTTFNVQSGTLAITAPLVQDTVDSKVSGLIETGAGTLILSGSNTYSGGTDVAAGTLIAASPYALVEGSSLIVGQGAGGLFAPAAAGPAIAAPSGGAAAVPEPGTFALVAAGLLAGLFFAGRKRQ